MNNSELEKLRELLRSIEADSVKAAEKATKKKKEILRKHEERRNRLKEENDLLLEKIIQEAVAKATREALETYRKELQLKQEQEEENQDQDQLTVLTIEELSEKQYQKDVESTGIKQETQDAIESFTDKVDSILFNIPTIPLNNNNIYYLPLKPISIMLNSIYIDYKHHYGHSHEEHLYIASHIINTNAFDQIFKDNAVLSFPPADDVVMPAPLKPPI